MWLMTVISGPATGSAVLMWQLTDIHSRQMNWQKTNACASVFFHMRISMPSDGYTQMLSCVTLLSCVLLIKDISKNLSSSSMKSD